MECSDTGPLAKYEGGDLESICGGCPLKGSKPESVAEELRPFVTAGFELQELKSAGARFEYPDGLQSWEWMSLIALGRGKAKADKTDRKRKEKKR